MVCGGTTQAVWLREKGKSKNSYRRLVLLNAGGQKGKSDLGSGVWVRENELDVYV